MYLNFDFNDENILVMLHPILLIDRSFCMTSNRMPRLAIRLCDMNVCMYVRMYVDLSCRKNQTFFFGGGGSATLCATPLPRPSIFSDYSFWIHHLVNRDDRHLLTHAMVSDFSVTWQFLSKITIVFFVTDQTPRPKNQTPCQRKARSKILWKFLANFTCERLSNKF
jgi:hypothetical protein